MSDTQTATRQFEMMFFKKVQTFYNTTLDDCGDIKESLASLKKMLAQSGAKLPKDRWTRLQSALRTGEIIRGKKGTPGDWATEERRALRAANAPSRL